MMLNIDQMVNDWIELIDIADNTMQSRPEMGAIIRRQYADIVTSNLGNRQTLSIEILETMQYLTTRMKEGGDQTFYSAQVMNLAILLGVHFPAMIGLASRAYECAIKTYHSDRMICPN